MGGINQWLWRLWLRYPSVIVLGLSGMVRVLWLIVALWGSHHQFDLQRYPHFDAAGIGYVHVPWQVLDVWTRWDGQFYLAIAAQGYGDDIHQLRVAFFPLYSLCLRAATWLSGWPPVVCGLLLSNVFDLLAWVFLARLARARLDPQRAAWALLAFAVFPTRNFGFSVYSEGLFLLLSVGAFYAYEQQRPGWAALCAACASAVRPQGILVGAALLLDVWWPRRRDAAVPAPSTAPPPAARYTLLLAPAGLLSFMAFLHERFADPIAFLHVQSVWSRQLAMPWHALVSHGDPLDHVACWGACALLFGMLRRRVRPADCVYVATSLLVPLCTGRILSMGRFVGVLFPLFIFAAAAVPLDGRGPAVRRLFWMTALIWSLIMAFRVGQGAKVI